MGNVMRKFHCGLACSMFILKLSRFKFFLCCYIKQLDLILSDIELARRRLSELIGSRRRGSMNVILPFKQNWLLVILALSLAVRSGGVITSKKNYTEELTWGLHGDSGPVLALRMKTLLSRERGDGSRFLLHVTCSRLHDWLTCIQGSSDGTSQPYKVKYTIPTILNLPRT